MATINLSTPAVSRPSYGATSARPPRVDRDGDNAQAEGSEKSRGASKLQSAMLQSLTKTVASGTQTSSSETSSSTSSTDVTSALTSFVQQLISALQGNTQGAPGGQGGQGQSGQGMPPPPPPPSGAGQGQPGGMADGGSFTKEQLVNSLDQLKTTDPQRYALNSNIVNNFSAADTNSDGKVNRSEAEVIRKSMGGNATSGASPAKGGAGYGNDFGAQMQTNLQSLITQLASTGASGSVGSSTTASDSGTSSLQKSFETLVSAMGSNTTSSSLNDFLQSLQSNLQGVQSSGNFVNARV